MDLLPVVSTYIETLANQDKFAKIVQYTSKLLAYYLDGTVVKKLNKLSSMISDGRRMNRIGTELKHIRVLSSLGPTTKLELRTLLDQLLYPFFMVVYIYYDHMFWFSSAGIIQGDSKVSTNCTSFLPLLFTCTESQI
eukprot:TRINITY_DN5208_c0_g1_i2.p1 TRINITY_DN5208_c0_g1~~TRINITY_DN5208_c0_g1_i2.p1  ORF type:complete len:137 (+),score=9.87 TRINITY_DN5208_c0_g1_i2:70-480(+)